MRKVAAVIVDNSSRDVDREFDYLIPEDMEVVLKPGMRVIVPFGRADKFLEGYVIEIKSEEKRNGFRMKSIADIAGEEVIISSEMMKLAVFLKNSYYCTMRDALQTLLPSGIKIKESLYIKRRVPLDESGYEKYRNILSVLSDEKFIEFKQLSKIFDKKLSRAFIFNLEKQDIVEIKREMEQGIKEKTVEVYRLGDSGACIEFVNHAKPKLKKQAEVLKAMMQEKEENTLASICEKYKCTRSVIKGLEEKGLLVKVIQEIRRNPLKGEYHYPKVELTVDQKKAINSILEDYQSGRGVSLLHGVTGCGKTEIYLSLVDRFLRNGADSIILVPEISLTPQTVERFKGRFGDVVAVLHSRLSEGERYDEWRRIKSGKVKVVVGARSAVFAPLSNLKLIVIDEEHEFSYKSEITPKYHAREVAMYRAKSNRGLLILGSATPSFESYYSAKNGVFNLVEISKRVDDRPLPEVRIVDMREELKSGNRSVFSRELYEGIRENLQRKNQTILFLNRRGYSTFVSCRACGHVLKCNHCDVSLTFHMANNRLNCHYCGLEIRHPALCPICGSKYIKHFGTGTEKIEGEIQRMFPESRVLRMDMDTTRKKGDHEKIYTEFKNNKADILIGTQMVTKGMDFKDVTLVGILAADSTLNLPDFRSPERTFQLITQVSGRAGRGSKPGRVVVQTYDPDNYSITYAKGHDYKGFYNREIEVRKVLKHPPYLDILYILLYSEKENELIKLSMELKIELSRFKDFDDIDMLGPTPNHISKIKNNYRWHIIFKGNVRKYYNKIWDEVHKKTSGTSINYSIDINPYNML